MVVTLTDSTKPLTAIKITLNRINQPNCSKLPPAKRPITFTTYLIWGCGSITQFDKGNCIHCKVLDFQPLFFF